MSDCSDDPSQATPTELTFYCRDCNTCFESKPDGTGYEQASCPECQGTCMTVQFESEQYDRNLNQTFFYRLLGDMSGLTKVLMPHGDVEPAWKRVVAAEQAKRLGRMAKPVTVGAFENPGDAEQCWTLLEQEGIEARPVTIHGTNCFIPHVDDAVALQVAEADGDRARQIVEQYRLSQSTRYNWDEHEPDITCRCEECGVSMSFPEHRRGGVETCPNCDSYVDVPE